MKRFDHLSLGFGAYSMGFFWSAPRLYTAADVNSVPFVVDLGFTVFFAVMAVWTFKLARKRPGRKTAHLDFDAAGHLVLACTDCGKQLRWIENGQDLDALSAVRDTHDCPAVAAETSTGGAA